MREKPVRVLVIDNLAVESSRREVYRVLGDLSGFEVHVLVPMSWKETRDVVACEPEEGNRVRLHCSRTLFGFRHQRVVYLDLPGVLRTVRPDFILAVAQPESYAGAQVCLLRRRQNPQAKLGLFSSRNIDYRKEGFPYKLKFTHRSCDEYSRRSRPEVCFYRPRAAADLLSPYGQRMVYVPHMVDCTQFRRMGEGGGSNDVRPCMTVGYVGRIVREKGVYVLLDALRLLPEEVKLRMIGTGAEEDGLKRAIAEGGLADRIQLLPPVPYRDVPAALNRMDLLVLPSVETRSWTELFGRILIEAMACEVPIVATNTGGIPEVVGEAALLVEPEDGRALADAILDLLHDPQKRRVLGKKGRERALERYDVPVVARLIGDAITESLERPT